MKTSDPVRVPVDGILDLHAFSPKDVKDLVPEYIEACREKGIRRLRLIHGKGSGTLRRTVRSILERNPHVAGFKDAGSGGGEWGATEVELKA
jgi:DNA-nicking Smr family endonuclease